MKFAALSETDSASEQGTASPWERYPSRASSSSSEFSEEQSSYALQERSSVCEDDDVEDYRKLYRIDTSSTAGVGSTVFQKFLCVFDEQRALKESQRQVTLARHKSQETAKKVVSLPQFLWQPGDGLCCQAGDVNFAQESGEMVVFEEPDDGYIQEDDENDDGEALLLFGEETSTFGAADSSFMGSVMSDGGTKEDPKYVPRPSSTTPGLKEVSKLFRTSSDPEGSVYKKNHLWEQDKPVVVTPPRASDEKNWDHIAPQTLTKSRSTPPFSLRRFHRRNSSGGNSVMSSISQLSGIGSAFTNKQHKVVPDLSVENKKTKYPVRSLFRRKKLPSFRKPNPQPFKTSGQDSSAGGSTISTSEENADVDSILQSLEVSLMSREEDTDRQETPAIVTPHSGAKKSKLKKFSQKVLKTRCTSPQPQDQPLATQGSGDTHSETSLEDLFSTIEQELRDQDGDGDCSYSSDDDKFFSTPYDGLWGTRSDSSIGNHKHPASSLRSHRSSYKSLQESMEDRNNAILCMHDLSRTSSVDTAKASNLSRDPIGDRARLLDLQASLRQQEEELFQRENAPPLDFEAGDNLIRVRDAMCEIEVLPKREIGPCPIGELEGANAYPGTRRLPFTAGEF